MLGKLSDQYEANKALATMYGLDKVPNTFGSSIDWHKEWVLLKHQLPWIRETSSKCGQAVLRDLEKAYTRFFKKLGGYPKFKKRGGKDIFTLEGTIFVSSSQIQLPTFGKVRLKEKNYPILEGRLKLSQATISMQADRWFVSFFIEQGTTPTLPNIHDIDSSEVLGVDLGIKELAITSDGQTFENPKAYKNNLKKLKKYQRRMSRKQKGSNNRKKAQRKLAKLHKRIADIRNDSIHKLSASLVKTKPKIIVIESLKPKNMSKNHKLAASILDSAFGKIKETMKYKCEWNGIHLFMAPAFYASSKFCSKCWYKNNEITLSDREWTCKNCDEHHDRDVNAAMNLQHLGLWMIDKHLDVFPTTVSSTGCYACGDERFQFLTEQYSSMKQEFKSI